MLRSKFRQLSDAEIADLVMAKFLTAIDAIVKAENPRSYFIRALVNAAIDTTRRRKTAEKHSEEVRHIADSEGGRDEDDLLETLSMQTCLASYSPRDQRILRAVAEGEQREEVARSFSTSRANVDQIVSRAKKRWKEWQ